MAIQQGTSRNVRHSNKLVCKAATYLSVSSSSFASQMFRNHNITLKVCSSQFSFIIHTREAGVANFWLSSLKRIARQIQLCSLHYSECAQFPLSQACMQKTILCGTSKHIVSYHPSTLRGPPVKRRLNWFVAMSVYCFCKHIHVYTSWTHKVYVMWMCNVMIGKVSLYKWGTRLHANYKQLNIFLISRKPNKNRQMNGTQSEK